jgi:hypothetical protein
MSLDDNIQFNPKILAGVDPNNPKEAAPHTNPINFDVRVAPNGSMDKKTFLD